MEVSGSVNSCPACNARSSGGMDEGRDEAGGLLGGVAIAPALTLGFC